MHACIGDNLEDLRCVSVAGIDNDIISKYNIAAPYVLYNNLLIQYQCLHIVSKIACDLINTPCLGFLTHLLNHLHMLVHFHSMFL